MSFKQPHRPQATRPRTAHRPPGPAPPTGHEVAPQATRPRTAHRPPARGGPTIDNSSTGGTNASYIVGPPLAGGLRRVPTGFRYRLWGHPLRVACGAFPLASVTASGATPCRLTRGGFLEKFVVKSLERPTERVALGTLLHRIPRPIRPKTSPCKHPRRPPARGGPTIYGLGQPSCIVGPPLAGGLWVAVGGLPCGWHAGGLVCGRVGCNTVLAARYAQQGFIINVGRLFLSILSYVTG